VDLTVTHLVERDVPKREGDSGGKPKAEAVAKPQVKVAAKPQAKAVSYEERMVKERVLRDADFVLRFEVRSCDQTLPLRSRLFASESLWRIPFMRHCPSSPPHIAASLDGSCKRPLLSCRYERTSHCVQEATA
jgi:hypothetical protein